MSVDIQLQTVKRQIAELNQVVANLGHTPETIRVRLFDLNTRRRTLATRKARAAANAKRIERQFMEREARLRPIETH